MKNRKWVDKCTVKANLIFAPFYEDETVATVEYEEDGGWVFSSTITSAHKEYLGSDSLENAKEDVERLLEEHYQDKINFYQYLFNAFKEE